MKFDKNTNSNNLLSVISNMIDKKLDKAPFNKSYKSTVIDIPSSGMATVLVNGNKLTLPCPYSVKVGNAVFVTLPCNIDEFAYISCAL